MFYILAILTTLLFHQGLLRNQQNMAQMTKLTPLLLPWKGEWKAEKQQDLKYLNESGRVSFSILFRIGFSLKGRELRWSEEEGRDGAGVKVVWTGEEGRGGAGESRWSEGERRGRGVKVIWRGGEGSRWYEGEGGFKVVWREGEGVQVVWTSHFMYL